ncbi:DUF4240 domain-containing protein [Oerskovia enterophila]|uniref:DUF4240 domain-containing protein n=1 Tax=Oerskovia enterophila TaxID=43678 RepID=UPI00382F29D2
MDHDTFWQLVDDARTRAGQGADDRGAQDDPLPGTLTALLVERLAPDEILAFAAVADEMSAAAYAWPVWGAAYLIEGGCSDDGFMDFRDGLVLAGRDVFTRTVADPDSLAEHPVVLGMGGGGSGWFGYESLGSLVGEAWTRTTGRDDEEYYAAREAASSSRDGEDSEESSSSDPSGESWDFDDEDENRRRLPRLASLFD